MTQTGYVQPADSPGAVRGSSLALLTIPWVHSQVQLLASRPFIAEAKKWGVEINLDDLEELSRLGLLVPFYRIDDDAIPGRAILVQADDYSPIAEYARAGQVRDPQLEGQSIWWPRRRPEGADDRWWDGYYYSKWQILSIQSAVNARAFWRRDRNIGHYRTYASRTRGQHLALAALSTRHFPSIVGQIQLRDGAESQSFRTARLEVDDQARLNIAAFDPSRLRPEAEFLLNSAHHNDPMAEWWPVIRHSDHSGWFKMKGEPLHRLWQRLAAEVFLRAHESLAELGRLEPIVDLAVDAQWWSPLHERITMRGDAAEGLDRSLGRLGVSPHPRVILVLEGDTEVLHVRALLAEFGIDRPSIVRVVKQGTSSDRPNQLARYAISPRFEPARSGRRPLAATPTALFIAMDPEGPWATEDSRNNERQRLQRALRVDIESEGARVTQEELDVLIRIFVWGEHKYELANFGDEALIDAIGTLADRQNFDRDETWDERLRMSLTHVRDRRLDIRVVFDRMQMLEQKVSLAELLLPELLGKVRNAGSEHELTDIPVLDMIMQIRDLVNQLSGSGYTLEAVDDSIV